MNTEFSFGQCTVCNKYKALKDRVCKECNEKTDIDWFMDLFKEKKNEH